MTDTFIVTTHQTPKRDVDLFGTTTVRIDRCRTPDGAGVPILYLSPYVTAPEGFAQAVADLLMGRAPVEAAKPAPRAVEPPRASIYSMPAFVEDVDWSEVLALADPVDGTDWKAWTEAYERRIYLATDGADLAKFEAANATGYKACPSRYRMHLGPQLMSTYQDIAGQIAA